MSKIRKATYHKGAFDGYETLATYPKGFSEQEAIQRRAKVDAQGRPYIEQHRYLEAVDEAALAAEEAGYHEGDDYAQNLSDDEIHMRWALLQDTNMTAEDYNDNIQRCPGYGPRPIKNDINKPICPKMRGGRYSPDNG